MRRAPVQIARPMARSLARAMARPLTGISTAGQSLPLDSVTSAVLAFSVARRLRTGYTGSLIRVRRSSDNAEQDIGYDGSNELDTTALLTFVGANDGYITKVYDQSGDANAVDWEQATAGAQPRIVNAGVVDKKDGYPAMFAPTAGASNEGVELAAWGTRPSSCSIVEVVATSDRGASNQLWMHSTPSNWVSGGILALSSSGSSATSIYVDAGTPTAIANGSMVGTQGDGTTRDDMFTALVTDVLFIARHENADLSNTTFDNLSTRNTSSAVDGYEYVAEFIVVTSAPEAVTIESNQADFYGITLA